MADSRITRLFSQARRFTIPLSVTVEVCYTCNEHCLHCCLPEHRSRGLTLQQYTTLFDGLIEAGTLFLTLTGGEPFSRPDFMEIVREARRRRFSVTIFSNATLLTPEIVAELARLHVAGIDVSVYSNDGDVHDAITRLSGSFDKTIHGVRLLVASGIPVSLKCPLMNLNFSSIAGMKSLARELGVGLIFATMISSRDNGDNVPQKYRMSRDQMLAALRDPEVTEPSTESSHPDADGNRVPCVIVYNGGAVDPCGNVVPCVSFRVNGGNVLDAPFGEIWANSPSFQRLRRIRVKHLDGCSNCELFQLCSRCPGSALLEDRDILGCSTVAKTEAVLRRGLGLYSNSENVFVH